MAFGIKRDELEKWKQNVQKGEISFLTHYWYDERFPKYHTVTKVGCADVNQLIKWGIENSLKPEWIHYYKGYPHFDLLGERQYEILMKYGLQEQIHRFNLKRNYF